MLFDWTALDPIQAQLATGDGRSASRCARSASIETGAEEDVAFCAAKEHRSPPMPLVRSRSTASAAAKSREIEDIEIAGRGAGSGGGGGDRSSQGALAVVVVFAWSALFAWSARQDEADFMWRWYAFLARRTCREPPGRGVRPGLGSGRVPPANGFISGSGAAASAASALAFAFALAFASALASGLAASASSSDICELDVRCNRRAPWGCTFRFKSRPETGWGVPLAFGPFGSAGGLTRRMYGGGGWCGGWGPPRKYDVLAIPSSQTYSPLTVFFNGRRPPVIESYGDFAKLMRARRCSGPTRTLHMTTCFVSKRTFFFIPLKLSCFVNFFFFV